MGKPITVSWADEIQRELETEIGVSVDTLPKEAITAGAYAERLNLCHSQALKRLKKKVEAGRAKLVLYKVRGVRQTVNGYVLT